MLPKFVENLQARGVNEVRQKWWSKLIIRKLFSVIKLQCDYTYSVRLHTFHVKKNKFFFKLVFRIYMFVNFFLI